MESSYVSKILNEIAKEQNMEQIEVNMHIKRYYTCFYWKTLFTIQFYKILYIFTKNNNRLEENKLDTKLALESTSINLIN